MCICNQLNGNQLNGNQLNGNQLNGNQLNGNQLNGNQLNGNQLNGNQLNGNQLNEVAQYKTACSWSSLLLLLNTVGDVLWATYCGRRTVGDVLWATYCGRAKCERDVLHCCGIHVHRKSEWEIFSVEEVSCFFHRQD